MKKRQRVITLLQSLQKVFGSIQMFWLEFIKATIKEFPGISVMYANIGIILLICKPDVIIYLTLATLWVVIGWSATSKSAAYFLYACCYVPSLQLMHATVVWIFALLSAMCGEVGFLLNHLLLMPDYQLAIVDGYGCLSSNDEFVDSLYFFVRGKNHSLGETPSASLHTPPRLNSCPDFAKSPGWMSLLEIVFGGVTPEHHAFALGESPAHPSPAYLRSAYSAYAPSENSVARVLDLSGGHLISPVSDDIALINWANEQPKPAVQPESQCVHENELYEKEVSSLKREFQAAASERVQKRSEILSDMQKRFHSARGSIISGWWDDNTKRVLLRQNDELHKTTLASFHIREMAELKREHGHQCERHDALFKKCRR